MSKQPSLSRQESLSQVKEHINEAVALMRDERYSPEEACAVFIPLAISATHLLVLQEHGENTKERTGMFITAVMDSCIEEYLEGYLTGRRDGAECRQTKKV